MGRMEVPLLGESVERESVEVVWKIAGKGEAVIITVYRT